MKLYTLWAFIVCVAACSEPEDVTPVDVRTEGHTAVSPPVDFAYHPPADNVSLPDTCDELQIYTDPFIMFTANKDVPGVPVTWLYSSPAIGYDTILDIVQFLQDHGADTAYVYLSGINKCIIATGIENAVDYNGRIFCIAGNGVKTNFGAGKRYMVPRGAMTFDQYWEQLQDKQSTRRFDMCNTGYSCEQVTQVLTWWLDNCIDGTGVTFRISCFPCDLTLLITQIQARGAFIQNT